MKARWRWVWLVPVLCAAAQAQVPRIDAIDPAQGPIAGGTVVTVRGANLAGVSLAIDKVTVAGQVVSTSEIRFTTPVHDNGFAVVKLTGAGGAAFAEFLYVPPKLKDLPAGYITTVAGVGLYTAFHGPATNAEIQPHGHPAFDREGNVYLPEPQGARVIRIRTDGILEPFAGVGTAGNFAATGNGDGGPALDASLDFCRGVTFDDNGDAYLTDVHHRIRKVDGRTGIITTYAGNGTNGYSGDGGPALQAQLHNTTHICGDGKGTLWFIDFDDATYVTRVRKITPDGIITTVAGLGPAGFAGDGGPATQAQFNLGSGDDGAVAVDRLGNLYLADTANHRIRRIDAHTGIVSTLFDTGDWGAHSVACDADGNVYCQIVRQIVKLAPDGRVVATYGIGTPGQPSEDGTPVAEAFIQPWDVAVDAAGNIVFTEVDLRRARRINLATGRVATIAGRTDCFGETGPAVATTISFGNADIGFLPNGDLLVTDERHRLIRKIDPNGQISSVLHGSETARLAGRPYAPLTSPVGLDTNGAGDLVVTDTRGIYRMNADGWVTAIWQGGDNYGYSGDGGPASAALLCQPWDVALDAGENLFVADTNNNRIRRIDGQTGIVTTIAGTGPVNGFERYGPDGDGGYSGDGGPAIEARLNTPYAVAIGPEGDLFISDNDGGYVRKIDPNGIITTVARGGGYKLIFDRWGQLYSGGGRVVRFGLEAIRYNDEMQVTALGSRERGFSGDGGPVGEARVNPTAQAVGVAVDDEGNVFFFDGNNLRIRAIRFGAFVTMPRITSGVRDAQITAGEPATFAVEASGFPSPTYQWRRDGVDILGATSPSCTLATVRLADTNTRYTVTVSNAVGSVTSQAARLTVTADATWPGAAGLSGPQAVRVGEPVTLKVLANGSPPLTYRWRRNGADCANGTGCELKLAALQPADASVYTVQITNPLGSTVSDAVIVGVASTDKVVGSGRELLPVDLRHPNGKVFDQVLVTGAAEAITADYAQNQTTRTSFIDDDDDIVQIEFSGPGALSLVLAGASGPATPVNYNQATEYIKGHAAIVITGATEDTNVSIFSVGRATAYDPTGVYDMMKPVSAANQPADNGNPLFQGRRATRYGGVADVAYIAIASANGWFGGVRAANARFSASQGLTGIFARGVKFAGPVFVGDISASGSAESWLYLERASDVRVTGGSLYQPNGKPVQVGGLTQLRFTAGCDSHGLTLAAQQNRATLMQNGLDVTAQVVVNPPQ